MSDLLRRSTVLAVALSAIVISARERQIGVRSAIPDTSESTVTELVRSVGGEEDSIRFTAEELRELQRRFGVHGPQHGFAQLLTQGVDRLGPVRSNTLTQLQQLKPVILRESRQQQVNPMLVTAILFDEIQHSKPGESLPFIAHSGLVRTLGPAQLGIAELIHQKRLPEHPSSMEIRWARNKLLEPSFNVEILAAKLQRLKQALGLPTDRLLIASRSTTDAKAISTLAYLHNGKLDYAARILSYMQDPELHGLIYSSRRTKRTTLV